MKYSIQKAPSVNINASLTLLTTVDRSITQSDYAQLEESTDHVVWYGFGGFILDSEWVEFTQLQYFVGWYLPCFV